MNIRKESLAITFLSPAKMGFCSNGRIKVVCEFSFEVSSLFYLNGTTLIISPAKLFDFVNNNMLIYFDNLKKNEAEKIKFKDKFERIFSKELNEFK